jgi:3-phosphoshikimate 1-carboxyvinyltransferase
MDTIITPSCIQETAVSIPPSKSLSHRALITAALAPGTSIITNLAENKDTEATKRVLSSLGAEFEKEGNRTIVHGIQDLSAYEGQVLDCGESGSTLRFLIPLFALRNQTVRFTGHGRLMERPQSVYEDLFQKSHLFFEHTDQEIVLRGPLQAGEYTVDGNVSSQFISGLLFALPLCKGNSTLTVREPFASKSYVRLTLDALAKAGIVIRETGNVFTIPGSQTYQPFTSRMEGDASQAAFLAELGLIQKTPLEVWNLSHDSHQGDAVIFEIIRSLGAEVKEVPEGYRIVPGNLKGSVIDLEDCPDLGPALFALASQCEGMTTFLHAGRLRIKESDRIAAMEEELRKLGCRITSDPDTVRVEGPARIKGNVTLKGHNDHRIVMALSVLATIADGPVVIQGSQAVSKSWPSFFEDLKSAGGKIQ